VTVTVVERDWTIAIGHGHYGLLEGQGHTVILVGSRWSAPLPFTAPVTAGMLLSVVLLFLFVGYYLIANLRHKDAPADAKLD